MVITRNITCHARVYADAGPSTQPWQAIAIPDPGARYDMGMKWVRICSVDRGSYCTAYGSRQYHDLPHHWRTVTTGSF